MVGRILIALVFAAGAQAGAATIKGTTILNELGGRPVSNVQIIDSAHTGGPWASGSDGGFTLDYPKGRHPGERVRLVVNKEGYVVVNDVQLDLSLPADPDHDLLEIIICKETDREEMARRFYRLKSFDAIEESYRKRLKELEDTQQATAAALTKLQQERDQAKAAAEKASEELAKNQPGRNSELYQQAKRLFLAGKIDEAIQLLDDEKLHQSLTEAKKAIDDIVQDWLLKAQLLTVQLRFDDSEKAYRQAIDAEPDSFEANFAYAYFNQSLKRFDQAKTAYGCCLEWARKNGKGDELTKTLNNLGLLDHDQGRMEEARKEFAEALQACREVAQENRETYRPDVAQTLNNLGLLDDDQGRMEEARKKFAEALQAFRELAQENPETYRPDVAQTLNNLGLLDHDQGRMEEARHEYVEALQTYRELTQKDPETYRPDVARTLNNLGVLDSDQGRVEEARKEYAEALQIRRELAQKNPKTYRPDVARTLNNLGNLDSDQGRMEEARKEFAEALQTFRELAQENPETYRPYLAATLNNLGALDSDQGRVEEARKEYAEALQIRRELAQQNPETYQRYVARTLNNLGILDRDQGRMEEARQEFAEALQIYETLARQDSLRFSADVTSLKKLLEKLDH